MGWGGAEGAIQGVRLVCEDRLAAGIVEDMQNGGAAFL